MKKGKATEWNPMADRWYPHELTCGGCQVVKPAGHHPAGWWRRFVVKDNRTHYRCATCGKPGALDTTAKAGR